MWLIFCWNASGLGQWVTFRGREEFICSIFSNNFIRLIKSSLLTTSINNKRVIHLTTNNTQKRILKPLIFFFINSNSTSINITLKMSISRTQNYMYHLNQNNHIKNIIGTRPAITDRISPATSRTLQHTHNHKQDRDISSLDKYQIEFQNKKIIKRIMSISQRGRSQLGGGGYARYNQFQRSFRRKNPYQNQKERVLMLQNEKIYLKLLTMAPRIGSRSEWQKQGKQKASYGKLCCRYEKDKKKRQGDSLKKTLKELQEKVREGMKQREEDQEMDTMLPVIRRRREV